MSGKRTRRPAKDDDKPIRVPLVWRSTLRAIVADLVAGRFAPSVEGVDIRFTRASRAQVRGYLKSYGDKLVDLPKETWKTSEVYWMDPFWDCFVDLWTEKEGRSDMVMHGPGA